MIKDISILTIQALTDFEKPKQPKPQNEPCTKENLYEFIKKFDLNEFWARNWFEWHIENGFKDKQGKLIKNWKGALLNYCKTKENGTTKKRFENGRSRKPLNLWR